MHRGGAPCGSLEDTTIGGHDRRPCHERNGVCAENYPNKPIEITAPYDAGGATDRMIRHLAPYLAEELGQPVNVVNRPGGGTMTGTVYFFNQAPDGYTVLFIPPTPYFVNHIEVMGAPYKLDDFIFVNAQEVAQSLMVVPKGSQVQSFDDIIAGLKEPGKLSAAVITGSSEHIAPAHDGQAWHPGGEPASGHL